MSYTGLRDLWVLLLLISCETLRKPPHVFLGLVENEEATLASP